LTGAADDHGSVSFLIRAGVPGPEKRTESAKGFHGFAGCSVRSATRPFSDGDHETGRAMPELPDITVYIEAL